MADSPQSLSRNPNLCASCSSLADGMQDSPAGSVRPDAPATAVPTRTAQPDEKVIEWVQPPLDVKHVKTLNR
jgi:hypothetical protein